MRRVRVERHGEKNPDDSLSKNGKKQAYEAGKAERRARGPNYNIYAYSSKEQRSIECGEAYAEGAEGEYKGVDSRLNVPYSEAERQAIIAAKKKNPNKSLLECAIEGAKEATEEGAENIADFVDENLEGDDDTTVYGTSHGPSVEGSVNYSSDGEVDASEEAGYVEGYEATKDGETRTVNAEYAGKTYTRKKSLSKCCDEYARKNKGNEESKEGEGSSEEGSEGESDGEGGESGEGEGSSEGGEGGEAAAA